MPAMFVLIFAISSLAWAESACSATTSAATDDEVEVEAEVGDEICEIVVTWDIAGDGGASDAKGVETNAASTIGGVT